MPKFHSSYLEWSLELTGTIVRTRSSFVVAKHQDHAPKCHILCHTAPCWEKKIKITHNYRTTYWSSSDMLAHIRFACHIMSQAHSDMFDCRAWSLEVPFELIVDYPCWPVFTFDMLCWCKGTALMATRELFRHFPPWFYALLSSSSTIQSPLQVYTFLICWLLATTLLWALLMRVFACTLGLLHTAIAVKSLEPCWISHWRKSRHYICMHECMHALREPL